MVVFRLQYFKLDRPGKASPAVVIDIVEIIEPVCPAVIEAGSKIHKEGKPVSHKSKIFPVYQLVRTEAVGADTRVAKADVVCLSPPDGSFVWGSCHVGIS